MLILASTSDVIRVVTSAVSQIEVHTSWVDYNGTAVTPGRQNTTHITTATTTTIVPSPGASVQRNVKHISIANDHASAACVVTVEHFDGTTAEELRNVTLLPNESIVCTEEGRWLHYNSNGGEYPPAGLGSYAGYNSSFMKTGTGSDAAGYWYGTWKDGGFPGAWNPGTPGLNGRTTDGTTSTDAGCVVIRNPSTGANYLTEINLASSVNHHHMFFDVLWVNSGAVITTTTAQAITSPTWPARDINGSTNGEGLLIGIMCTAAVGLAAVASNATVTYTNSDGTGSRTATLSAIVGSQAPATPVIGTIIWFNLQAGDKGVRSIQSLTLGTTWVSGTISLFVARPIASVGTAIANVSFNKTISEPGIRLYNGICMLHCVLSSATTATFFAGDLVIQEK
jgi:hypothetical protein